MKTFFSVFAAILAAAIVIFSGLYAVGRVNQWERELAFCYAQGESLQAEARAWDSQIAMTSDNQAKIQLLATRLDALKKDVRAREIDRKILALLENKPFGLPLTAQERKVLDTFKASLAQAEEAKP